MHTHTHTHTNDIMELTFLPYNTTLSDQDTC